MSKKRLRAVARIRYPDKGSLAKIRRAGGMSKMNAKQLADLNHTIALPGEFCDDVLPVHRDHWLAKGVIEEVDAPAPPAKKKGGK